MSEPGRRAGPRRGRGRPRHPDVLTPAEWRVVDAVRHGMSNRAIARGRGVSLDAVKFHVSNAVAKLGLADRAALRRWRGAPARAQRGDARSQDSRDRNGGSMDLRLGPIGQIARPVRDVPGAVAWYRDVLGMQPFWDISFHTQDVAKDRASGSGLRSIVMWDPISHVKFATNEPLRPHYRDSQIAKFVEDNMGPGVQHVAFAVDNILWSVEELLKRGVDFMDTPKSYYMALPERLAKLGITNVKEEIAELERLQILVDGAQGKYMLQIFLREAAALHDDVRAGPFFYEVIQRCGDEGFGYGNFRALFESIERFQKAQT